MSDFILDKSIDEWYVPAGEHEKELIDLFRVRGDTFLDIGGHLGTWSLRLFSYFNRVVAFEPQPTAFVSFLKNLELNNIKNVSVNNYALSDLEGIQSLSIYKDLGHSTLLQNHLDENIVGNKLAELSVSTSTLDTCFKDYEHNIDLIKIDVEGVEDKVIEGGLNIFRKHRPNFIIEAHSDKQLKHCQALLKTIDIEPKVLIWGIQKHLVYKRG